MITRHEYLLSKQNKWASLGDLYGKNNQLDTDFNFFLNKFSATPQTAFVYIIPYGVVKGMVDNEVKDNQPIFMRHIRITDIPQYFGQDGTITYQLGRNHSWTDDYSEESKRQDFICRISISQPLYDVSLSDRKNIGESILSKFRIRCIVKPHQTPHERDIDFLEYWNSKKRIENGEISITGDLVSKVYLDTQNIKFTTTT